MRIDTIEQQVLAVIKEILNVENTKIILSFRIKEDLCADSIDQLCLMMALEDKFNENISEDEAAVLLTVGDAVEFMENRCLLQSA